MTLTKTGIETIENQGETSFCWLFAVARSIVRSMWMRSGLILVVPPRVSRKILVNVSSTETRNLAIEFLQRKKLYQIVRREICFGLIPKTLKRKLKLKNNQHKILVLGKT